MKRMYLLYMLVVLGLVGCQPIQQDEAGLIVEPMEATTDKVTSFTLSAPFEVIQSVLDFAPGSWTPKHHHGGPILVTVLEGEVTVRDGDGAETIYNAGDSWVEEPGLTIAGGNDGGGNARLVATTLLPEGAEITTIEEDVDTADQPPGPTDVYEARMPIDESLGNFEVIQTVMDFAPGSWTPLHHHGGPILVTLLEGEITVRLGDGSEMLYKTGDSWIEEPGIVIAAGTDGKENALLVAASLLPENAEMTTMEEGVDTEDQPPGPTDIYEARMSITQATEE